MQWRLVLLVLVAVAVCASERAHATGTSAHAATERHHRRVPPSTCTRDLDCSAHGRCGRWALWSDHYHVVSALQLAMTGELPAQRTTPSSVHDAREADALADALALLAEDGAMGAAGDDALWLDEGEAAPMLLQLLDVDVSAGGHAPTMEDEERLAEANAPRDDDPAFAGWVAPKTADGRDFDLSDGFDSAQGDWDDAVRSADALDEDQKDADALAAAAAAPQGHGKDSHAYMPTAAEVAALAAAHAQTKANGAAAGAPSLSLLALEAEKKRVKKRVAVWTPKVWPNTCRCARGWSGTYCNHATAALSHAPAGTGAYPWPAASDLPPVRSNTYRVTCELLTRARKHVFRKEVRVVPDACRTARGGEGDCFTLAFQNFKIPQKGFIKCTLKEKPLEAAKVASGSEEKVKFQGAYVLARHDRHTTAVYATPPGGQVQVALKVQQVNGDSDIDALSIKLDQGMFSKLDAARNPQPVDLQSSVAAMETVDAHHARREHMLSAKLARTKRPAGEKARNVPAEATGKKKKKAGKKPHVPRAQPYDRKHAKLADAAKRK